MHFKEKYAVEKKEFCFQGSIWCFKEQKKKNVIIIYEYSKKLSKIVAKKKTPQKFLGYDLLGRVPDSHEWEPGFGP